MKFMLIIAFGFLSVYFTVLAEDRYISCKLLPDLGDSLFQVATTHSLAWDNDAIPYIYIEKGSWYYDRSKIKFQEISPLFFRCNQNKTHNFISTIWKDPTKVYHPIPYVPNMELFGFFCFEKHFAHHRDRLLKLFAPSEIIFSYIKKNYPQIFNHECSVGVHIQENDADIQGAEYLQYGTDYLRKASKIFQKDALFVVASNNIEFAREVFPKEINNVIFVEENEDYISLFILSLCKNNIISNSSFGWWSAWLNSNLNKKMVVPSLWCDPISPLPIHDYSLIGSIKIDAKRGPLCLPETWE